MADEPSQASMGAGAAFGYGVTNAGTTTYTEVLEVVTIGEVIAKTVGKIDCTHLKSPGKTKEFLADFGEPGAVSMTGNYIGDDTQQKIQDFSDSGDKFPWQITVPLEGAAKTLTIQGIGYIAKFSVGPFEAGKKIDCAFDLQISGKVLFKVQAV